MEKKTIDEKGKLTQQQWVKDILFEIITKMIAGEYNGDFDSTGYTYTINAALDNYSQIFRDTVKHKNVNMFHKYHKYVDGFYKNILVSEEANKIFEKFRKDLEENKGSWSTKVKNSKIEELKKKLHGEHMTPQSYSRHILNKSLNSLCSGEEKNSGEIEKIIKYALTDAKLCILAKAKQDEKELKQDEKELLDKAGNTFEDKLIEDFKNEFMGKIYDYDVCEFMKKDIDELKGKSIKSNGFGSIRLYYLWTKGVRFIHNDKKIETVEECMKILNNDEYTL